MFFPAGPDLNIPLTEQELADLQEMLLQLSERFDEARGEEMDCILDMSELDGFLTTVVIGPTVVMPSRWLPAIWGGEMPPFASEDEAQRVTLCIMRHMNSIVMEFQVAPREFMPLFNYREVDDQEYAIVDEWCYGFLRGVALMADAWSMVEAREPELLATIALFGSEAGWNAQEGMDAAMQGDLRNAIPAIVVRLWERCRQAEAAPAPLHRGVHRVGRNDPCPCGSGRKYKQCCLQ